ncbi:MAG: choice-of-anchor D domain-containing protein, partial [Terriglobales bacterium]
MITVAGNGTFPSSGPGGGDGGPATQAQVSPRGLAFDAVGNLYISDPAAVREVNAQTGVISTVAGTGTVGTAGDGGPATQAQLGSPEGLALDGQGDIFIADGGTFGTRNKPIARIARVREVSAGTGVISTVAGGGTNGLGDGGPAVDAALILPQGLAFDAAGNLYITDEGDLISPSDGSSRVREVNAQTSVITTVAGGGAGPGSGDGGPASQATLQLANRVLVDPAGNLFIADELGYAVRRVDAASGDITTVAGTGVYDVSGDGGSATSAAIGAPYGLTLNGAGDLFILADGRIRKVANAAGLPFLAPASLDFGAQPAGSTSTSESLVLTNPSSSPFAISSITAGAGFAETNTCGSALAAGATCSISVTFTPAAVGAASGSLTVTPGSGNPLKASLSGTGSSGVDTVTLQPVANQTLPVTSAIQLQATGLSTGAITYSATGPATVSGNQLTVTGVGTVTVTAMQAADANYNAGTASVSFTVSKGTQTITFAALANHLTTDAGFTFAATSSSGLSVSFTVLSGPATLNGSTVT